MIMYSDNTRAEDKLVIPFEEDVSNRWLNPAGYVLLLQMLLAILLILNVPGFLRVVLAAVYMLFGSGYALIGALFPPRKSSIDSLTRITLAGGASLAIGGLVGVAIAKSTWSLNSATFMVVTFFLNLIWYFITVYRLSEPIYKLDNHDRNTRLAPAEGSTIKHIVDLPRRFRIASVNQVIQNCIASITYKVRPELLKLESGNMVVTVILVFATVTGIFALNQVSSTPGTDPPFTTFFLTNEEGLAENFNTSVSPGQQFSAYYGIDNREGQGSQYELIVSANDELIGQSLSLDIDTGTTFQSEITMQWPDHGILSQQGKYQVEFQLYLNGQLHRSLHLWYTVLAIQENRYDETENQTETETIHIQLHGTHNKDQQWNLILLPD